MLTFRFNGVDGKMTSKEILTSGMIGKEVKLEFSEEWKALKKTVVFSAGGVTEIAVDVRDPIIAIPAEVLAVPGEILKVGVYGVSADGKATPTIYVNGPKIESGADPVGDSRTVSAQTSWAWIQQQIEMLDARISDGGVRITADGDGNVTITSGRAIG